MVLRWLILLCALALTGAGPAYAQTASGADSDADTDSDSESREPNAESREPNAESRTPNAESRTPNADSAKAAVVVAGDPDEELRAAAQAIDQALGAELRRPSDPGLRGALRGAPAPETDDGLERVRRERRGLGFGEDDRPTLARLGRMAGADVLVVVVRREGELRAEVFDVHAERFYRDTLAARPLDAVVAFTSRAARATRRRTRAARENPGADAEPAAAESGGEPAETTETVVPTPAETAAAADTDDEPAEDDEPSPAREWFKKNWAFLLAGVLLVGVVTGFVIRSRRDDPDVDAVIVFRPGE